MKFKKLITLASLVGLIVFLATTVVACTSKSENTETKTAQVEKNKEKELKEALDKAKSYDKSLKTSYYDLRVKLLEEDFSDEAINYALSNAGIDWKQNALEKAKDYAKTPLVSRYFISGKLNQDRFHPSEVKFALDNVDVDWKKAAIEKAKDYAKNDHLSRSMTEFKLQNLDGFEPEEEVKYAVENSGINWKEVALERAKEHKQGLSDSYTASELREILKSSDKFGDEEIQYALDNLQ